MNTTHELIILGSGPAGLSASIYAARYNMDFLNIGQVGGGTITESHLVENYPGFESITGLDLGQKMTDHAKKLGARLITEKIQQVSKTSGHFTVHTVGSSYKAKRILLAMGAERNKLRIPGEEEFIGKGVAYCATCDGFFYKKKRVAVIGGGDAAVTSALYLADIASEVYLIYRGDQLKAEPGWLEKLKKVKSIKIIYETNVEEIKGTSKVESIKLDNTDKEILLDGVFIEIGSTPNKALLASLDIKCDEKGYVFVDHQMKTNTKGVWSAGDITHSPFKLRQIVTAVSEGAVASYSIYLDIKEEKNK